MQDFMKNLNYVFMCFLLNFHFKKNQYYHQTYHMAVAVSFHYFIAFMFLFFKHGIMDPIIYNCIIGAVGSYFLNSKDI